MSRSRYAPCRFIFFLSCFFSVALACKSTEPSGEAGTKSFRDPGFMSKLYLLPGKSSRATRVSFKPSTAYGFDWESLPPGVERVDIDAALSSLPDAFWAEAFAPRYVTGPVSPLKMSLSPAEMLIEDPRGRSVVPVESAGGRPYLSWEAMRAGVSRCPFSEESMRKSPLISWLTKEAKLNPAQLMISSQNNFFTSIYWHKTGVRLFGSCELTVHDGKRGVQLSSNADLTIDFPEPIFDFPAEDKSKGMFFAAGDVKPFSYGGRQVIALNLADSEDPAMKVVSRLDISKKVGIDDLTDTYGQPLTGPAGAFVVKTVRALVQQLREEIPALGRQLVLSSEDPKVERVITFRIDPTLENPGVAGCAESDISGTSLGCQVVVWVGGNQLQPFAQALQKIGVLQDIAREVALVDKAVVTHEFAHALGVTHNFGGLYLDQAGKPVITSVMGYPFGLPFQVIGYDATFFPHDILALKFIYADSIERDAQQLQAKLLPELARYPLIMDGEDGPQNLTPVAKKLAFMKKLKIPAFDKIKAADPETLKKLEKVYKEYLSAQ